MIRIVFVIALRCEGAPLIKALKLKRFMQINDFEIYRDRNEKIILAFSGIGMLNVSNVMGFLAGYGLLKKEDILVNLGICGSADLSVGTIVEINKISHHSLKRKFYPFFQQSFDKHSVEITSNHLSETAGKLFISSEIISLDEVGAYPKNMLVDMESYGFFHAAQRYITIENILLLKIVSDQNSEDLAEITKAKISSLIENALQKIFTRLAITPSR